MAKASSRPPLPGPPLTRILSRIGAAKSPTEPPVLPAVLSTWVDWNRAVVLARALDAPAANREQVSSASDAAGLEDECVQAQTDLRASVDVLLAELLHAPATTALLLKRVAGFQRSLQIACGRLRGRLRDALACASEDQRRLAELDAVMEQVLSPREFRLLEQMPTWATQHCAPASDVPIDPAHPIWPDGLPPHLCADLRELLLAELELRFHPIQGLRAALHSH